MIGNANRAMTTDRTGTAAEVAIPTLSSVFTKKAYIYSLYFPQNPDHALLTNDIEFNEV